MLSLSHLILNTTEFFREVKTEAKRVNWPTRQATMRDTLVVIIFALAVAIFLSSFDFMFQKLLETFVF